MRAYNEWIAEFCGASPSGLLVWGSSQSMMSTRLCRNSITREAGAQGGAVPGIRCKEKDLGLGVGTAMECGEEKGILISFHQGGGLGATLGSTYPRDAASNW